jgi:hypothetical protein
VITLGLDVIGLERVYSALDGLTEGVSDLRPFWEKASEHRYEEERDLFAEAPWKPLTPAYAKWKQKRFGDKPILRATDTLFRSLTQRDAEGSVYRIDDSGAEFGSSVFYGHYHVPTRDPMADPDVREYENLAGEYLRELVREVGFS